MGGMSHADASFTSTVIGRAVVFNSFRIERADEQRSGVLDTVTFGGTVTGNNEYYSKGQSCRKNIDVYRKEDL